MGVQISRSAVIAGLCLMTALSGCTRMGFGGLGGGSQLPPPPRTAEPVRAAPRADVQSTRLKPAGPTPPAPSAEARAAKPQMVDPKPDAVKVAKAEPAKSSKPVTRQTMVGRWTVNTGGAACEIFLALTKWQGGYRAAARGCSVPGLKDVQAWDVKSNQVVLVDSSGSQAASLFRSADERYDGSTSGGGAISFSR